MCPSLIVPYDYPVFYGFPSFFIEISNALPLMLFIIIIYFSRLLRAHSFAADTFYCYFVFTYGFFAYFNSCFVIAGWEITVELTRYSHGFGFFLFYKFYYNYYYYYHYYILLFYPIHLSTVYKIKLNYIIKKKKKKKKKILNNKKKKKKNKKLFFNFYFN